MPRPRTARTTRSHHKKPVDPALEAMVDTISDEINPEDLPFDQPAKAAPKRASTQKPGPKKVISETTKIVGDGVAVGILLATQNPDTRKSLTMPEAQSIGHPVVRMLARRVPGWIKPYLPKTKMDPDDAADVEEILATLAVWGMRLVTVLVTDFVQGREQAQAKQQQQKVMQNTNAQHTAAMAQSREVDPQWATMAEQSAKAGGFQAAPIAQPTPNGHDAAFDILAAADFGFSEVV